MNFVPVPVTDAVLVVDVAEPVSSLLLGTILHVKLAAPDKPLTIDFT